MAIGPPRGIDVTTCYGVHFDPFDPRHMFISYTDIGLWASDTAGASWYSATRSGVPRQWENTTYWMEFDPDGARPHVGRHERHARSAASQDVAPRLARFLHRRRGAQRRWRTHLARAE